VDSEEDPSFDEEPITVELPDIAGLPPIDQIEVTDHQDETILDDLEQGLDKITETVDLPMSFENGVHQLKVLVKERYVSSIAAMDVESRPIWEIKYFLGERLRKQAPTPYAIAMEGKQVRSIQLNVEPKGNKVMMRSFGLLAVVDQKIEEEQLKKIKTKEAQLRRLREVRVEEDNEDECTSIYCINSVHAGSAGVPLAEQLLVAGLIPHTPLLLQCH
jgi:hypothetical protein